VSGLTGVLIAIFSAGGALAIGAFFKGWGLIRNGAERTEGRAILNLERYRDEADERARQALHRLDYQQTLTEHYRSQYADLAFHVRNQWGAEHLLPVPPPPVYEPLSKETKQQKMLKRQTDDQY
jgi:hypothetical protein